MMRMRNKVYYNVLFFVACKRNNALEPIGTSSTGTKESSGNNIDRGREDVVAYET